VCLIRGVTLIKIGTKGEEILRRSLGWGGAEKTLERGGESRGYQNTQQKKKDDKDCMKPNV